MTEVGPHLLGRTVNHDPANREFPFPRRKVTKPVSVIWPCPAPILNQGDIGSCEGSTAVEWLNCTPALRNRRRSTLKYRDASGYFTQEAAVAAYSKATWLDEDKANRYPPVDTGTSAVGIAKAMKFYRAIDKYEWTFSWVHFLAAIQTQPVMLGTNWYSSMYDPARDGTVEVSGSVDGGHAYLARGVDFKKQRVLCRNHWGPDWGLKGEFWLSFATLQRLLGEQGDVLVPTLL